MTRKKKSLAAIASLVMCGFASAADAPPAKPGLLGPLFVDHAVVQRDRPINVWGEAGPGESVTVTFASATVSATADARGQWHAALAPQPAGGPHTAAARSKAATPSSEWGACWRGWRRWIGRSTPAAPIPCWVPHRCTPR